MKVLVTGVGGQLGHDVMNELAKRGYEGVGSDIAPAYAGIADGSAVTTMPYVQMDITDSEAVVAVIGSVKPDVVIHCAAWTAVDLAAAKLLYEVGVTHQCASHLQALEAGFQNFFHLLPGHQTSHIYQRQFHCCTELLCILEEITL